jgi:CubicO group peptidase (beta-lactamase class C family)
VFEELLEGLVAKAKKEFGLPTIAAGIVHKGQFYVRTTGSVSPFRQADADTVYRIASISKSFIAGSIMMLVQRGAVALDEPVVSYLPDFRMADKKTQQKISVRDILSHRSGLTRHDLTLFLRSELDLAQMVGIVEHLDPAWALGERFHYQNHMYAVASLLIERVSGMPWGDFVKENIFVPLGMQRSYTAHKAYTKVDGNFAPPRIRLFGVNLPFQTEDATNGGGAGSISASMTDILKWVQVNLDKGGGLLSPALADELHGHQTLIRPKELMPYEMPHISEQHYGFGWVCERYRGIEHVHHGGTVFGYKAEAGFVPGKDFGYAVFINQQGTLAAQAVAYTLIDEGLALIDKDFVPVDKGGQLEVCDWNRFFRETLALLQKRAKEGIAAVIDETKKISVPESCFGDYWHPAYGKLRISGSVSAPRLIFQDSYKMRLAAGAKDEYALNIPRWACVPCHFKLEGDKVVAIEIKMDPDLDKYVCYERKM